MFALTPLGQGIPGQDREITEQRKRMERDEAARKALEERKKREDEVYRRIAQQRVSELAQKYSTRALTVQEQLAQRRRELESKIISTIPATMPVTEGPAPYSLGYRGETKQAYRERIEREIEKIVSQQATASATAPISTRPVSIPITRQPSIPVTRTIVPVKTEAAILPATESLTSELRSRILTESARIPAKTEVVTPQVPEGYKAVWINGVKTTIPKDYIVVNINGKQRALSQQEYRSYLDSQKQIADMEKQRAKEVEIAKIPKSQVYRDTFNNPQNVDKIQAQLKKLRALETRPDVQWVYTSTIIDPYTKDELVEFTTVPKTLYSEAMQAKSRADEMKRWEASNRQRIYSKCGANPLYRVIELPGGKYDVECTGYIRYNPYGSGGNTQQKVYYTSTEQLQQRLAQR